MKRRNEPPLKEDRLARKRALIRSLMEQAAQRTESPVTGACTPETDNVVYLWPPQAQDAPSVETHDVLPENVIPFPRAKR